MKNPRIWRKNTGMSGIHVFRLRHTCMGTLYFPDPPLRKWTWLCYGSPGTTFFKVSRYDERTTLNTSSKILFQNDDDGGNDSENATLSLVKQILFSSKGIIPKESYHSNLQLKLRYDEINNINMLDALIVS